MNRKDLREGAVSTTYSQQQQQKQRRLSTEKIALPSRKETQSVDMTRKMKPEICPDSPMRSNNPHMNNAPISLDDYYDEIDTQRDSKQFDSHSQNFFRPIQPSRTSNDVNQLQPFIYDDLSTSGK